jgi:hypothetical protein
MGTSNVRFATETEPSNLASFSRSALWLMCQTVRLPAFSFLVILAPLVRFA